MNEMITSITSLLKGRQLDLVTVDKFKIENDYSIQQSIKSVLEVDVNPKPTDSGISMKKRNWK